MNNEIIDKFKFKIFNPIAQFNVVKEIWTLMIRKCPHVYFQSWGWVEIWINSLPADCNLFLVVGYLKEIPVIAFFVGSKTATRHRYFKFHQLSLNSSSIRYVDNSTHIEYNTMLIDPEITIKLNTLLSQLPLKWDEFYMPRFALYLQPTLILSDFDKSVYRISTVNLRSYYVDLEKIRDQNNDYLSLLSQNRRKQIRRSLKEYEKMGQLKVDIAHNIEAALNIYSELIVLHQKRWIERGHSGSFSNPYMVDFYKQLIINQFVHGEIQLMKISAGNYTIGCLYNFIYNGKVMALLGGLSYLPENYYLPGFVCDYYAVIHNAMAGYTTYELMEGDIKQKKSLSTDNNALLDIIIQKNTLKHKFEKIALTFYSFYKST